MAIDNNKLDSQISAAENKLESIPGSQSRGAYTDQGASVEASLRKLKALKSTNLSNVAKQNWYTSDPKNMAKEKAPSAGVISGALEGMQKPLRAIVGATKYATGLSGNKGLVESIDTNIKSEKDEFSGVLKQLGMHSTVAAPLGFILDVALDPVNWLTLGGGASVASVGKLSKGGKSAFASLNMDTVIPKMAVGLKEGGITGMAKAAQSSGANVLKNITKFVPGSNKSTQTFDNWLSGVTKAGIADLPEVKELTMKMAKGVDGSADTILKEALEDAGLAARTGGQAIINVAEKAQKATKFQSFSNKLQDIKVAANAKAAVAKAGFEKSIGFEGEDLIYSIIRGNAERVKWSDVVRAKISQLGGNKFLSTFDYNPTDFYRINKIAEELRTIQKGDPEDRVINAITDPAMRQAAMFEKVEGKWKAYTETMGRETIDEKNVRGVIEAKEILKSDNPALYRVNSPEEAAVILNQKVDEFGNFKYDAKDIDLAVQKMNKIDSGLAEVDEFAQKLRTKLKDWTPAQIKVGEKLLGAYDNIYKTAVGIFKAVKVGGFWVSPAAHINSMMGNPIFAHMFGLDITRPAYLNSVANSWKFYRGKNTVQYAQEILGGNIEDYATKYPAMFANSFGFAPTQIKFLRNVSTEVDQRIASGMMDLKEANLLKDEIEVGIRKASREAQSETTEFSAKSLNDQLKKTNAKILENTRFIDENKISKAGIDDKDILPGNYLENSDKAAFQAAVSGSGSEGFGMLANELNDAGMVALRRKVKAKADKGEKWAELANYVLNKGPQGYESIDQGFRLGTFAHLVKNGLTEGELQKVSRAVNITQDDLTKVVRNGETLFQIAPDKANEMVSIIYMNYAAMPAFVKMMKNAPIIGSPFYSFAYGMMGKTAQTLADNPAAFNKVSNAMNSAEVGFGGRTPLEKKALATNPAYSWYNQTGMLSLKSMPFFKENALYLNLTNWIPYMSLNMLNPSERKYDSTWPGKLAGIMDKTPLFKGPAGAVLYDYFIQSQLLGIKEPQNQFGGLLYPKNATGLQKGVLYPARTLAEAWVPPTVAAAGFVNPLSDENISLVPSYGYRKVAFGQEGKSSVGVKSKTTSAEKGIKDLASIFGVSVNTIDLDKLK